MSRLRPTSARTRTRDAPRPTTARPQRPRSSPRARSWRRSWNRGLRPLPHQHSVNHRKPKGRRRNTQNEETPTVFVLIGRVRNSNCVLFVMTSSETPRHQLLESRPRPLGNRRWVPRFRVSLRRPSPRLKCSCVYPEFP